VAAVLKSAVSSWFLVLADLILCDAKHAGRCPQSLYPAIPTFHGPSFRICAVRISLPCREGGEVFKKRRRAVMRAVLCHCRVHLEARDDEALHAVVRDHLALEHPAVEPSEEQVEEVVSTRAYNLEYAYPYADEEVAL
jgi:hypothetical protein